MLNKNYYLIFVYMGAALWALMLFLQGIDISWRLFKPLPDVGGILFVTAVIFDRWIWKWRYINRYLISVPNLQGTWQGKLVSSWIDPKTNETLAPIDAYIVIKQTFTSIRLQLITKQSCSNLINGALIKADGNYRLMGIYMNEPRAEYLDNSPIHYGGILLKIQKSDTLILEGLYWTSRATKGDMHFTNCIRNISTNFEDCKRNFKDKC